ncbi:Semaphorin-1A [Amphibalanus amphitrite]|uniref:Semaphorin-1A n=1 Tax=Amphibalanus amphitrite TaxID=1232801 RepID=A0A6A4WQW8_AMPAM|nr:Semaphorin-1A [Amphibalanus amphitrite]
MKLDWPSNASTVELCKLKGKPEVDCQNYIRVLAKKDDGGLFVCGTNAFSPICRHYQITEAGYELEAAREERGIGKCPYSPTHNSTSTYADGHLYSGTAADFSGQDPLILRDRLRTDKWDTLSLDDPDFVSSFALGEHVYFFFRETAVEYINCGKACLLYCGVMALQSTTYDIDITSASSISEATSDVVEGSYGGVKDNRLIYGVFSTPPNAIGGSAVCAFRLQRVLDAFSGQFKERADLNSNWLPVPQNKVPPLRPGQCSNSSKTLPDATLNFIKGHPLMDEAVAALFGGPILTRTSLSYRFSAITVDPRVRLVGDGTDKSPKFVDVLFVGTDNGRIIKVFNAHHKTLAPVVIEEIQAFSTHDAVKGLHISRTTETRLVASSDSQMISLPVQRCYSTKITVCGECVALQDPYCAWHLRRKRCVPVDFERLSASELVQNVREGVSRHCPEGVTKAGQYGRNMDSLDSSGPAFGADQPLSFQSERGPRRHERPMSGDKGDSGNDGRPSVSGPVAADDLFTAETLAVAVAITAIVALLLGFAAGHCCARRCRKDDANMPYADTDYTYFDQRQNVNTRLAPDPTLLAEEVTYSEPVLIPTNSMAGGTLKKNQTDGTLEPLRYTPACAASAASKPERSAVTHAPPSGQLDNFKCQDAH